MKLTLTQRLSLVFAVLLLVCCGTSAWMQVRSSQMHELEVVQGLSRNLAQHIAQDTVLMDANGLMPDAVRELFSKLMQVNPSVEVYLLLQVLAASALLAVFLIWSAGYVNWTGLKSAALSRPWSRTPCAPP